MSAIKLANVEEASAEDWKPVIAKVVRWGVVLLTTGVVGLSVLGFMAWRSRRKLRLAASGEEAYAEPLRAAA